MVGKPHFLEFYIAVNMGQLFIYGHKGMLGVHGVLHQLSEGGNVVILFLVVMLQGLGGQALKGVVYEMRVYLGLQHLKLSGAVDDFQFILPYDKVIDCIHHFFQGTEKNTYLIF